MQEIFVTMACNNAWANATFYDAARSLPADAFCAPAPGFFPTLSKTLNHIYEVDLYYLDALEQQGLGHAVYQRQHTETLAELGKKQSVQDAQLIRFCRDLSKDDLSTMRKTEREKETVEEDVSALLLHLFQHQIHHRGQAHVQLHALGIMPPQLDEFHLRFDRVPSAQTYWQ